MPQCFRCGSPVKSSDVRCRNCGAELKAFGHAGIPLHRATGEKALCDTCVYHADDSCDYPQRPTAQECTMYRDLDRPAGTIERPGARKPKPPIFGPTPSYPNAPEPFTPAWWNEFGGLIGAVVAIVLLLLVLMMWR
jgi:hypothetical protein